MSGTCHELRTSFEKSTSVWLDTKGPKRLFWIHCHLVHQSLFLIVMRSAGTLTRTSLALASPVLELVALAHLPLVPGSRVVTDPLPGDHPTAAGDRTLARPRPPGAPVSVNWNVRGLTKKFRVRYNKVRINEFSGLSWISLCKVGLSLKRFAN